MTQPPSPPNDNELTPFEEFRQRFMAAKGFAAKRDEFNRFFWPGSNQQLMLCIAMSQLLGIALIISSIVLTHRN